MTLPKEIKHRLRKRFDELLAEADRIRQTIQVRTGRTVVTETFVGTPVGERREPDYEVFDAEACLTWMTSCTTLVGQVIPRSNPNYVRLTRVFKDSANATPHDFRNLVARLQAVKNDFDEGLLDDLGASIERAIAGDYMGQAEQLINEGQSGEYDHVPAAVLAGAVLEKALRSLCERRNPPIPTALPDGKLKTLSVYIDDLKKAGVYNETKAKQLRAWASVRNHAAHGEFDEFDRKQVQEMLTGIQNFLADNL